MKEGNLRVYNIINPPSEAKFYPVNDIQHAKELIDSMAQSQLLDDVIFANAFGLEVFKDGEWIEWNDDEGRDLDEHFEDGENGR